MSVVVVANVQSTSRTEMTSLQEEVERMAEKLKKKQERWIVYCIIVESLLCLINNEAFC